MVVERVVVDSRARREIKRSKGGESESCCVCVRRGERGEISEKMKKKKETKK